MGQALIGFVLAVVSKHVDEDRKKEADCEVRSSDPTGEVILPEDKIDWRKIRWVAPRARYRSMSYRDPLSAFIPDKPWMMGKTDSHHNEPHSLDEHSWKATSKARRQFARHLRKSWGRMERSAA